MKNRFRPVMNWPNHIRHYSRQLERKGFNLSIIREGEGNENLEITNLLETKKDGRRRRRKEKHVRIVGNEALFCMFCCVSAAY